MQTIVNYAILSTSITLTEDPESKKLLSKAYQSTNWKKNAKQDTLYNVLQRPELISIQTQGLTVIDFDTNHSFEQALEFNGSLADNYQCKLIVKSKRKGGHFYFLENTEIPPIIGHTKQAVLDILTTDKHNVIAPTVADQGKEIITPYTEDTRLTQYNISFNLLVEHIVKSNLPESALAQVKLAKEGDHSDDNIDFVKAYLAGLVEHDQFNSYYHIPDPIPQGMSNDVYLRLSTRLGSDVTIDVDTYLQVMEKFNSYHQRKTQQELLNEITNRMVSNQNGLWKYDPEIDLGTFTVLHKYHNTKMFVYFDIDTSEYIVTYRDTQHKEQLHIFRSSTLYIEFMEKVTLLRRDKLRATTNRVTAVTSIHDYTKPSGYNKKTGTYNKALHNENLQAFGGAKPQTYSYTRLKQLLEMLKYMWGEEYEYMLSMTKYRYTTFQFSPVVTFLQGTEGSGKDLSIALLTAGFTHPAQQINYVLLKDKHSNWQTEENAVFSEIGSWRPIEQDDLLSNLKSISGSNGEVTYRGMQKTAIVVKTIVKIWVTGNEWVKLHTDPLTQRRIHVVYMPRPLTESMGGPYSTDDIAMMMQPEIIADFYYWLGNEYEQTLTSAQYRDATSRQHTESYKTYIDATQSKSDKAAALIWEQDWDKFKEAMSLFDISLDDLSWKYNKQRQLVITVLSLKNTFSLNLGSTVITKTIDRIAETREGNKRLKFDKDVVEKYITIYNAPDNLGVREIPGENIDID
ncbi:MAG: hypothetical protein GXO26_00530 [Crenarchaeota archaeon]|nr:hypothetical protein [Thermoproteota archaeon]